ncbi:hypothetical protein L6R50_08950 [Myxococcota bacterium]|nr:hypothetical protein [Myxococcota bacterium]
MNAHDPPPTVTPSDPEGPADPWTPGLARRLLEVAGLITVLRDMDTLDKHPYDGVTAHYVAMRVKELLDLFGRGPEAQAVVQGWMALTSSLPPALEEASAVSPCLAREFAHFRASARARLRELLVSGGPVRG